MVRGRQRVPGQIVSTSTVRSGKGGVASSHEVCPDILLLTQTASLYPPSQGLTSGSWSHRALGSISGGLRKASSLTGPLPTHVRVALGPQPGSG